jgi:hypothetical protein
VFGLLSVCLSVRWANFSSFGFAKGRLVCRVKPNVPFVRWLFLLCLYAAKISLSYCWFVGLFTLTANVLALGEEADFEALNCLPALHLIRSTKLHLSTEPAFLPNACYSQWYIFCSFKYFVQLI